MARREERLRNDQIMAVAGLAAGTAHELGTPLSTMTVLLEDMLADPALGDRAREDCRLLQQQLTQCRSTLAGLVRTAELGAATEPVRQPLGDFLRETVARWAVRRPGARFGIDDNTEAGAALLETDSTLGQALENLLNNAADTGTDRVAVSYATRPGEARIIVGDRGPGISRELLRDVGKPIVLTSRKGLGIGLLLSHANVERFGGRIELQNRSGGGTEATLYLPLVTGEGEGGSG